MTPRQVSEQSCEAGGAEIAGSITPLLRLRDQEAPLAEQAFRWEQEIYSGSGETPESLHSNELLPAPTDLRRSVDLLAQCPLSSPSFLTMPVGVSTTSRGPGCLPSQQLFDGQLRDAAMLIDRYITRAQANSFLIVFVSLAGLTFVVDAFNNIEEFIAHADEAGGLWRVLGRYYGFRLISFFDATSGVIALASAMFALSWLERHNELTALLAAGVTRWRIARPAIVFAGMVAIVAATNRELVLPQIRDALAGNAQDLSGDAWQQFEARYDHRTEILYRGQRWQRSTHLIQQPSLLLPPSMAGFAAQIDAAEAAWLPGDASHPAGYLLRGVSEPASIDAMPGLTLGGVTVIHTKQEADWLAPGSCFVASDVSFEQLVGSSTWSLYSSTPDLVRAIGNPAIGVTADVPLRVHARIVQPVLDLSLAILGLPLVVGPSRKGVFVAVGLSVVLTAVFLLTTLGCHALATSYVISPSLGAWLPVMLLAPLAAWQAQPMWQ
jgi:lipopolysaccharide export system permease protein